MSKDKREPDAPQQNGMDRQRDEPQYPAPPDADATTPPEIPAERNDDQSDEAEKRRQVKRQP